MDLAYTQDSNHILGYIRPNGEFMPIIMGAAEGDPDPASGEGASGDPTPGAAGDPTPGKGDEPKTFTQEEVNALMTKEASKAARGKLDPKELGFDSAKEMQEFIASAKERADAEKDEAQKELEKQTKEAYERGKTETLSSAKQIALRAEFTIQATKAGVVDPAGAFLLAQAEQAWEDIQVADDGSVTGLDDAFFAAFKETKPYLFGVATPGTNGTSTPKINPGAGGASSDDAAAKAAALAKAYPALQQAGIQVPQT